MAGNLALRSSLHPFAIFCRKNSLLATGVAALWLLTGCGARLLVQVPTAADYCREEAALLAQSSSSGPVLQIWSNGARHRCGRSFAPAAAALRLGLGIEPVVHERNAAPLAAHLVDAANAGIAPDLAMTAEYYIPDLVDAGAIVPVDDCRASDPEFDRIQPVFWDRFQYRDQTWAVPIDAEHQVVYYNKEMLRRLGWSEVQIEALPGRAAAGLFTLDDLKSVARSALDAGIVAPGYGFVSRLAANQAIFAAYLAYNGRFREGDRWMVDLEALTDAHTFYRQLVEEGVLAGTLIGADTNTWGNRVVWRDAQAHGRFLFWDGYNTDWMQWQMDYADVGTAEELERSFGRMVFPSGRRGMPGRVLVNESVGYVIFTPEASGRTNQEYACALVAELLRDRAYTAHIERSGHLHVTADPPHVMHDYLQPFPFAYPGYVTYRNVLREQYVAAASGRLTPRTAAEQAAAALQRLLGDESVVVR